MNRLALSVILCSFALSCVACDDSSSGDNSSGGKVQPTLKLAGSITQQYSGNIESVRVVPGRSNPSAVAVSSKTKTLHYLEIAGDKFNNYREEFVYSEENVENEFTNSAVVDENMTLVTHTIVTKTGDKVTNCEGEIMSIAYDSSTQKTNAHAVEVGPMPDAIAVTPDKRYAISADEHDSTATWGKCPVGDGITPSVSILSLTDAEGAKLEKPVRVKKITFTVNSSKESREPEYIAIASDNDTVAVTLQDSHEVALFSLKAVLDSEGDLTENDVKIVELPKNPAGSKAWPDGVTAFDIEGKHYFAMAGEANDTIIIIDDKGNAVANPWITKREVPTEYPCLEDSGFPGVNYSPDSVTAFVLGGHTYVAATLRYAGAVIIYDVSNPAKPVFERIDRAGKGDLVGDGTCKGESEKSGVYPEGISSEVIGDVAYVWVANEGDNTVTALKFESMK